MGPGVQRQSGIVNVLPENVIWLAAAGVAEIGGTLAVVISGADPGVPPRGIVRKTCAGAARRTHGGRGKGGARLQQIGLREVVIERPTGAGQRDIAALDHEIATRRQLDAGFRQCHAIDQPVGILLGRG